MRRALVAVFFVILALGTTSLLTLLTGAIGSSCGKGDASLLLCVGLSATSVGVLLLALVALGCTDTSFRAWLRSKFWDISPRNGATLFLGTAGLTGLAAGLTHAMALTCTAQPSIGCSSHQVGLWVILGLAVLSGIRLLIWYAHQATRCLSGEPLNPNDRRQP